MIRLDPDIFALLACPACKASFRRENSAPAELACPACGRSYPSVRGVPILINEDNSIFSIQDYVQPNTQSEQLDKHVRQRGGLTQRLRALIPQNVKNIGADENYARFAHALLERTPQPLVLVIGAGAEGAGMSQILKNPTLRFINTEIFIASNIHLVVDGHDIPLQAESVDGVIIQAVLEHVVDPARVVQEIYRVLKPNGLVYAETPFMQQVHMGRYDFTRFTHLGHRRLFRQFDEIASGAACGAGSVLAWSIEHFFLSFAGSKRALRAVIILITRLLFFWLPYLDKLTIKSTATLDAASSYYFLGSKGFQTLPDRLLIQQYRGAQQ
ncbi:methyltransferase type 11 [candidate division KSB1 bacterium]|nr:MAG: methyltransferase type 11 [candidate division KSB1 bacterium]